MKTIDIDVGGTFTDLVRTWDDRRIVAKAPTTPPAVVATRRKVAIRRFV